MFIWAKVAVKNDPKTPAVLSYWGQQGTKAVRNLGICLTNDQWWWWWYVFVWGSHVDGKEDWTEFLCWFLNEFWILRSLYDLYHLFSLEGVYREKRKFHIQGYAFRKRTMVVPVLNQWTKSNWQFPMLLPIFSTHECLLLTLAKVKHKLFPTFAFQYKNWLKV